MSIDKINFHRKHETEPSPAPISQTKLVIKHKRTLSVERLATANGYGLELHQFSNELSELCLLISSDNRVCARAQGKQPKIK